MILVVEMLVVRRNAGASEDCPTTEAVGGLLPVVDCTAACYIAKLLDVADISSWLGSLARSTLLVLLRSRLSGVRPTRTYHLPDMNNWTTVVDYPIVGNRLDRFGGW